MDDVSILNGKIQRHATRRRDGVATDTATSEATKAVKVVNEEQRSQSGDAGAERVAGKDELEVRAMFTEKTPENGGFIAK